MLHLSEYVAESTLHVFFSVSQCLWESPTPTRRVTAGDVVTSVVTSHVSHGCESGESGEEGEEGEEGEDDEALDA